MKALSPNALTEYDYKNKQKYSVKKLISGLKLAVINFD